MQVHCGSLDLLGEVGVDNGFFLTFVLCLFEVSNFKEYDDDDFRDNFTVGVCNSKIKIYFILSIHEYPYTYTTFFKLFSVYW